MTFGEKLKRMRSDNGLTQDELADKIFVTRTAISKWETDRGYPSIDSLKAISKLFSVSIDELISDDDIENKRALDERWGRRFYWCALACFGVTSALAVLYRIFWAQYLLVLSLIGAVGYTVLALLSKPRYKRIQLRRERLVPWIISRTVIAAVLISVIIFSFV